MITINEDGSSICFENEAGYTNVFLPDNVRLCKKSREIVEEINRKGVSWSEYGLKRVWEENPIDISECGGFLALHPEIGDLWSINLPDDIRLCRKVLR